MSSFPSTSSFASSFSTVSPNVMSNESRSNALSLRLWQVASSSHPQSASGFPSTSSFPSASGFPSNAAPSRSSSISSSASPNVLSSSTALAVQPQKVSLKEDRCFRPILPVQVEFANGKRAYTYDLLDSGSNRMVMTSAFVKSLQGRGIVSTGAQIVGAAKLRSVVDWKLVNDVEFVEVDDIPVEKYHVAMNKDVEQFEHMHGIQVVEL